MKTRKQRRHDGRNRNKEYNPEQGFYNEQYWDDWNDYRDGQRDINSDPTLKKPKHLLQRLWDDNRFDPNKKIHKLLKRRRRMKSKRRR
jgi:hypothetical protein